MHCKFKVGDYVERIGRANTTEMPVGWRGEIADIEIDHGDVWLHFDNKPRGDEQYFKLVGDEQYFKLVGEEPKVNTPEITVGSKWVHKDYKSFIVSVFHVNSNGTIAVKVENTGDYYKDNEDDGGVYEVGNIFVYNENEDETALFTDCYTPYIEPKTIVRYVIILKKKDSGEFVFSGFNYDTQQEAKSIYDRCFSATFDLIKIIEVKYTEGEE